MDRIVAIPCIHTERINQVVAPIPRMFFTKEGTGFRASQDVLYVDNSPVALEGDQAVAESDHRSPRLQSFVKTPKGRASIAKAQQEVLFVNSVAVGTLASRICTCCEFQPDRIGKSVIRSESKCSLEVDGNAAIRAS